MGKAQRLVKCEICNRQAPSDEISDGGYLYEQYGWEWQRDSKGWPYRVCPVCSHGPEEGQLLLKQIAEIRKLREENANN